MYTSNTRIPNKLYLPVKNIKITLEHEEQEVNK